MPEITRQQIIDAALSFEGVLYKAGGQGRAGLNCAGLFVAVGRETGYLQEDIPGFSAFSEAESMQKWFGRYLDPVPSFEEAQPGDVIATIGRAEEAQHCALLIDKSPRGLKYSYVFHVLRNYGAVRGRLFGPYLREVSGFYKFRGIVD